MPKEKNNQKSLPHIGIVYLLYYHNESYVDRMAAALESVSYPKEKITLIIVSNPHDQKGSFLPYIKKTVCTRDKKNFPKIILHETEKNAGFADGNNIGADIAVQEQCDYIFFHNNDGFVAPDAFEPIVAHMEENPTVGLSQMLMLLYPEQTKINSIGNNFHYLGFGYCNGFGKQVADTALPAHKSIHYASGAALMVRVAVYQKHGGFDADFFMYHEDLEWSLRLRLYGYDIHLVRDSIFYHEYEFSRSIKKFFWMERNRYAILILIYKYRTLFLLFPMLLIMELGQLFFAWRSGWLKDRINVYRYWLKKSNRDVWLKKRKKLQSLRVCTDKELLKNSTAIISFQQKDMEQTLITKVANPIMKCYYKIIYAIVQW